jgi:7-cyano-7-deazaguanine synthase
MQQKRAVLLLSGGLDSTTMLALATNEGYAVHALSFDYAQRHAAEIAAARAVSNAYGVVEHKVIEIDLRTFGGSALTAQNTMPKDKELKYDDQKITITNVPPRKTIILY